MLKDEIKIIKLLKKGNTGALKYLFDEYYEKLYFYALKLVDHKESAEEVVQDVFISIWTNRRKLSITLSLKSYLYVAVKNKAISYLRQKIKTISFEYDQEKPIVHSSCNPEIKTDIDELEFHIHQAIKLLPDKCRMIFNLSRNSGMTYKEIAVELDISTETVKTQISIALKKLKVHLEKYWDTVPY